LNAVTPSDDGCHECLAAGGRWVHLRMCQECGHVGCCDSSPSKHATAHFHGTSHPVVRLFERAVAVDALMIAGDLLDIRSQVALDVQAVAVRAALRELAGETTVFVAS